MDDFESYDALALAALVRDRQVSAEELVAAAIGRIEARNPQLNAVVLRLDDSAREAARAFDRSRGEADHGAFAGVPFLLKDLIATCAATPTTASCRLLSDRLAAADSELVARYRRAGLIFAGKTNTPEFGILPVTESRLRGPARNPWNLAFNAGGSSGGTAAAVAAGMVPAAHGSDGGGSIRIPASCCGLFGLKPTRGRIPMGPVIGDLLSGFVQEHVITRSVRDSAALLDATCGADAGAPYAAPPATGPFLAEVGREPGRLRIAWTAKALLGNATHPECRAAVEDAAQVCAALGHDVEEAAPALDVAKLVRTFLVIGTVDAGLTFKAAVASAGRRVRFDDLEPQSWLLATIGRRLGAIEFAEAQEAARLAGRAMARFLTDFDLLLTPTMAYPPLRVGELKVTPAQAAAVRVLRRVPISRVLDRILDVLAGSAFEATANTMLFNMTGQPAMSMPLFWTSDGLPIGVQFAARFGAEATLLRLAAQLEATRPWFLRRPTLP
ncbi:MAG: amidase [Rhodospirillales bacterium]|nr:amidase [Rhodospirillales bacterium]